MSIETLPISAIESSSYIINVNFTDETGSAVMPNSITWTLTDLSGNIINNREDVPVTNLSSSISIVLSGDDLAIIMGYEIEKRLLTIKSRYTSSEYGQLPLVGAIIFNIINYQSI